MSRTAVIIGAGPAGLTAALELLRRTDIKPIVVEASGEIGGISRTIRYKGNRMDIGGHRFFSKSDRVMQWWMDLVPPETRDASEADPAPEITYQGHRRTLPRVRKVETGTLGLGVATVCAVEIDTDTEETEADGIAIGSEHGHTETQVQVQQAEQRPDPDLVMLIRPRKSRIYYLRSFFDYPIRLSVATLTKLGLRRTFRVGISYIRSRLRRIRPEKSLEDFIINRFGRELYLTFFKSYTEKVWGTPCAEISAEWGAQRIKGLSLTTAVKHFVRRALLVRGANSDGTADVAQKGTDTSLIERFLYPKLGPGQLWEHVASEIVRLGGEIHLHLNVDALHCEGTHVRRVSATDASGCRTSFDADYVLSTMPMRELVRAIDVAAPPEVREISEGLQYRDFITVGLLCDRLKVEEPDGGLLKDTWIYVQEPDVLLGRLQIFNNWSPFLVSDASKVWIGLEYFCYDSDALWKMSDEDLKRFAIGEVARIGIVDASAVSDGHVVRVPKTYPAYFGTYARFDELRAWTDSFENLFLIGRNGMHKYNNQDHSMLTAMTVVDGLAFGAVDKTALWSINTEQAYHEEQDKRSSKR